MRFYDRCLGLNAVPSLKPHIDPTRKWSKFFFESYAIEVWVKIGVVGIVAAIAIPPTTSPEARARLPTTIDKVLR
jgi:hypothetical protein